MNPMIKYRGGKSREIIHFINNMPKEYSRYIEPFFGAGALFFYLQPEKAIINDINYRLYSFYQEMKEKYPEAREQLDVLQNIYEQNQKEYEEIKANRPEEHIANKNEALYYLMRDAFNHKAETAYLDSVAYYFINKTAYSGMIRYNANGEYNVPFGRYKHFNTKLSFFWIRLTIVFSVTMEMKIIKKGLEKTSIEGWRMILEIFPAKHCW